MADKIKMAAAAHVTHHRVNGQITDLRLAEASAFAATGHKECMKANCNDEKRHSTKNHSGWPALKKRHALTIGKVAVGGTTAVGPPATPFKKLSELERRSKMKRFDKFLLPVMRIRMTVAMNMNLLTLTSKKCSTRSDIIGL